MNRIKLSAIIIAVGMFVFLFYSFIVNHYTSWGYPYNTFLCSKIDKFMDFYNVNFFIEDFNPYSVNKDVSYPPFPLIIAYPFSLFFDYALYGPIPGRYHWSGIISYILLLIIFSTFLLRNIYISIKGNGKINDIIYTVLLFVSYPICFVFDRGNYIMITFIFVYLFVYYYHTRIKLSIIFLSMAIAMKIYPILFIMLFIVDKRYKDIIKIALISFILSFIPILLFKGSIYSNISNFLSNFFSFSRGHVNEIQNLSWNSSINGIIKIPLLLFNNGIIDGCINMKIINYVLALFFVFIVFYLLKKEKDFGIKISLLITLQILIMPISYDYNLIYLYIPLLYFLKNKKIEKKECFFIIIISLLFIPKSYGILFHDWIWNISIQSFINPILLMSIIIFPFINNIRIQFKNMYLNKNHSLKK